MCITTVGYGKVLFSEHSDFPDHDRTIEAPVFVLLVEGGTAVADNRLVENLPAYCEGFWKATVTMLLPLWPPNVNVGC